MALEGILAQLDKLFLLRKNILLLLAAAVVLVPLEENLLSILSLLVLVGLLVEQEMMICILVAPVVQEVQVVEVARMEVALPIETVKLVVPMVPMVVIMLMGVEVPGKGVILGSLVKKILNFTLEVAVAALATMVVLVSEAMAVQEATLMLL